MARNPVPDQDVCFVREERLQSCIELVDRQVAKAGCPADLTPERSGSRKTTATRTMARNGTVANIA